MAGHAGSGETTEDGGTVTVTLGQPLAPDAELFGTLAQGIWERARWSNGGPLVAELERGLEEAAGWRHVVATASGTSALTTALLALGLPRGGEVITSPLTFRATPLAIEAAGLTPVFVSSDPHTLTLDPSAVEQAIHARTVAILPVHLFGVATDTALDVLAEAHGLPVVYDAAHAYGFADIVGRGTATAYSLHATKLLHTGEGGFVATDDGQLDQRLRHAVNFGIDRDHDLHAGINGKMSELAAAVGLAAFPRLSAEVAARESLRLAYATAAESSSRVRVHAPGRRRALVMDVVRCDPQEQASIIRELAEHDVIARGFPALCGGGERYADRPVVGSTARDTDELSRSAIALPFHGRVQQRHIDSISEVFSS
ncbi:DegT/DnrJ/EryC1/StrS family aminotransferase [Microbacterium saperdae]